MLNSTTDRTPSSCGRPRRVTDAMITEILAWHASPRTLAQKAAAMGIATNTLKLVVVSGGKHYKQPSPEHRQTAIQFARHRRSELRAGNWL